MITGLDRIERDILIQAPLETVWKIVTEPAQLSRWFSDAADFEFRPRGEGTFTWNLVGTPKGGKAATVIRLRVEKVEPPFLFSFRWNHPPGEEPRVGNSAMVEFRLTAEENGTRLRVIESGLASLELAEDEKRTYYDGHVRGWDVHMRSVVAYVAGTKGT